MAAKHIALIAALSSLAPAALAQNNGVPSGENSGATVVMSAPIPDSNPADPGLTGSRPISIRVLSAADHALFQRAFAQAAKGDWAAALALGNQGTDTTARQLLQWRYALDRNSGAKFADIDAMMKVAATWPLKGTLQARAEAAISPDPSGVSGMTPAQVVQWFSTREPNSSLGRVRLGEALVATGQTARGGPLIARGWAEGSFDYFTEQSILSQDAAYLTPESDRQRLDNLLWRGETTAARRQMTQVDATTAAVARARILLEGGTKLAKPALDAVASSTDPALLFDWARALRQEHNDDAAHQMLMRAAPATLARDHTARWWAEVSVEARDMLTAHDAKGALAMVEHAGLPGGDEYVDQQFLGGFIELRFLSDPTAALTWFQRLTAAVSRPISKSRGEYWLGRAYEALGDTPNAIVHYRQAAAYPETFYGQLGLARIEAQPVLHLNQTDVVAAERGEIENDPLMPEIRVLADLGLGDDLRLFAEADATVYSSPRHLKAFMEALRDWGYPEIAVRLAKNASYAGDTLLEFTHPLIPLPSYPGDGTPPDPALVLGLIRQETEFNAYAISSAGARGLMQVMTFTARKSARIAHLPYRPGDLLSDRNYNIDLGMVEFAGHMDYWGGSILLSSAGYNAGDTNALRWVASFGDPRNGAVDPLDFIEQIPFSETRNYVQRVLENTEVYRNRLAGRDMSLQIMADLYAPMTPPTVVLSAPVAQPAKKTAN
jgi:soluble lytic murein transglycosylase